MTATLAITSTAFADGAPIPARCTCEGDDRAPPLAFSGVPSGARSLALVVDDPDAPDPAAPKTVWVHWVVHELPPDTAGLPEGGALPAGARQGLNDWKRAGYGGPCPPIGRHRYFFKLYALDAPLDVPSGLDKNALLAAMEGKVLAQGELIGTYER
jgi:Raf kinase inhibitor-like YbhB/YbcL family protein